MDKAAEWLKMLADEQDGMTWYDLQTEQGDLPTVN